MIKSPIKKLFRRCLLTALIGLASGCASTQQMPSKPPDVVDRSEPVTKSVISSALELSAVPYILPEPIQSKAPQVPDKNLALETPPRDDELVKEISAKYKISAPAAREIVSLASKHAYEDFPKRNDILAIIAVESSYKAKALLRGCYGLMQVEKKSHVKRINGRSLFNPAVNIEVGVSILREYYLELNKNPRAAILAYNAGIGNYQKRRFVSEYHRKYLVQLKALPKA